MALIGTYCSDSLGRRPMLIAGTTACATCLAFAMMCSAIATHGAATVPSSDSNQAGAKGAIAFLILFYGAYGWTYIPLLAGYGPEVLSTEQRSAGMGIAVLSLNLSCQSRAICWNSVTNTHHASLALLVQLTTPICKSMRPHNE